MFRRAFITCVLLSSICGIQMAHHEVTCEVQNVFDKGEGKEISECKFDETIAISEPSATLSNAVDENVKRLLMVDNKNVEYLPQNIGVSFPNLELFDTANCSIKSVTKQNFIGLTALDSMYIHSNKLQSLDENVFSDLVNLRVLYLGDNLIMELPTQTFQNLEKLENLYLFNNLLTTLNAKLFVNNKKLEFLDLSNNKLQNLPPGIFDTLSFVRFIYLDYNHFQHLPPHIFDHCASLERIYLASNKITQINGNWFDKLTSLKMVSFESNSLTSFDFAVFDTNKNFSKIDIRGMNITIVKNVDKIKQMPNLQTVLFVGDGCVNNDYNERSMHQLINDVKENCSYTSANQ